MFEASMHPIILGGDFQYLGLEKRIHATRVIRVAFRWEIAERRKNVQLVSLEVREYFRDERHNARASHFRKSRNRGQRARRDAKKGDEHGTNTFTANPLRAGNNLPFSFFFAISK